MPEAAATATERRPVTVVTSENLAAFNRQRLGITTPPQPAKDSSPPSTQPESKADAAADSGSAGAPKDGSQAGQDDAGAAHAKDGGEDHGQRRNGIQQRHRARHRRRTRCEKMSSNAAKGPLRRPPRD